MPFNEAAVQFLSFAEGEYTEHPSTFRRIRSSFSYIRHFFGGAIVAAVTEGHVEDFKAARRKMEVKEISIRHDLHALSLFFQYAVKKQWARENIVRKVAIPSDADAVRMNVLSQATERLYFETCLWMGKAARFIASPSQDSYFDLYDFGRLMILQGTRPEELLELSKASVSIVDASALIESGKTRSARRRIRLTRESIKILTRRLTTPGPWVFPSPSDPQQHRGPTWRGHGDVLEAMKGKPDAAQFVPYDLRHTFATRAAAAGVPLPVLAAMLGHGNLRSVFKYVHLTEADTAREMERLDSFMPQVFEVVGKKTGDEWL